MPHFGAEVVRRDETLGIPNRIFQFGEPKYIDNPPDCQKAMQSVRNFTGAFAFEYQYLTLSDTEDLFAAAIDQEPSLRSLLVRCDNYGHFSDLLRFVCLYVKGGWWLDWDIHIIHPARFAEWLSLNSDFSWVGVIDGENDTIPTEFQGGVAGNGITLRFLQWCAARIEHNDDDIAWYSTIHGIPSEHSFFAGPEMFTRFMRSISLAKRSLRLEPFSHVFQASYSQVKGGGATPQSSDHRPLHHHWQHGWKNRPAIDLGDWIECTFVNKGGLSR